jgi:hypothetical protein
VVVGGSGNQRWWCGAVKDCGSWEDGFGGPSLVLCLQPLAPVTYSDGETISIVPEKRRRRAL